MLRQAKFAVAQAFTSMIRSPLLQVVAVSTIGAAVLVFCLLQIVTNTTSSFVANFSGQVGLVVFIKPDTETETLSSFVSFIDSIDGVRTAKLIDPQTTLTELNQILGDGRFNLEEVNSDLLPLSIQVEVRIGLSNEQRAKLVKKIEGHAAAETIHHLDSGDEISSRLQSLTDMIQLFGGLVALLVTVAVLFVISNTMRLAIHAREREIEIMQWVGASHLFIRIPFYIEGATQGVLSAIFALFSTRSLIALAPQFTDTLPAELQNFRIEPLGIGFELALLGTLVITGIVASHLATQRYFRKQNNLWF